MLEDVGEIIMQSLRCLILDMALPNSKTKDETYYHGTGSKKAIKDILTHGIKPNKTSIFDYEQFSGGIKPVEGLVYLTKSLQNAVHFAENGLDWKGSKNPRGWVVVVNGNDINNEIFPDEDDVGMKVIDLFWRHNKRYDLGKLEWLVDKARKCLPGDVLEKLNSPDVYKLTNDLSIVKKIGNFIIGQLSSKEQLLLISVGDNIAHQGAIKASEIWEFNWKDLDKIRDGGAFFDTAKRIK